MTWSYSGDPSTSSKDEVRFLVGDTDSTEQLIQDEEILYQLSLQSDVKLASANIAEGMGAKYSRKADTRLGDYSVSYSQISKSFYDLASKLRGSAKYNSGLSAIPYCGGIYESEKEINEEDINIIQPKFKMGMQEIDGDGESDIES